MRVKIFSTSNNIAVVKFRRMFIDKAERHYRLNLIVSEDDWYEVYIPSKADADRIMNNILEKGYGDASDWMAIHARDFDKCNWINTRAFGTIKLGELLEKQCEYIQEIK